VHRKVPHLGGAGTGVHRKVPHLGSAGTGVHRKVPHLGNAGRNDALYTYLAGLAARLRHVRVCCGDWSRVCGPTPTLYNGRTAIFLDPPYADDADRAGDLYAVDSGTVAAEVRAWAVAAGDDPRLRIALCSYGEAPLLPGWERVGWKANGGYGNQGEGRGQANAAREVVDFSPHCLPPLQARLL
jgi:hypothetical protein